VAVLGCAALVGCSPRVLDAEAVQALFGQPGRAVPPIAQDPALVEAGRVLFHRPLYEGALACVDCHALGHEEVGDGGTLSRPVRTADGTVRVRQVPALVGVASQVVWGWDGWFDDVHRARLEDAVAWSLHKSMPATGRRAGVRASVLLGAAPLAEGGSGDARREVHPEERAVRALTAFLRSLRVEGAWERYVDGDVAALSQEAHVGLRRFVDIGCATCHGTRQLGGRSLHPRGLAHPWPADDPGRRAVTGDEKDRFAFEAPPLRWAARTGPWFHDGSASTLEDAIARMAWHELDKELRADQVASIAFFLREIAGVEQKD